MCDLETLRLFVNERLTAVAEDILAVFVRTIVQYQQQIDLQHRQLEFLTPQVTSDLTDFLPVCEEEKSPEQQERRSDLVQEEPQPPQIKDEQQELIHRPEEAEGSTLTIIAVRSEYNENRETEPQASTSNEHVKTQADVENCGASQPTVNVQLISSHCSESDTDDSDDWEETREDQSLKSHKTHTAEGQIFSLRNKLSQPTMRAHTRERTFSCTVCGKTFNRNGNLKRHTRTHTDFLPVCEEDKSPVQQERMPDLLQEEPQPPHMNGEQRELIHRPEEAEGSTQTLLAATSGYNDNRETEPLASNHFISSNCSESDTEDSDECETREDKSLKTQTTHTVEGRRFSLRNKLSQDLISLRLTPSMRAQKMERTVSCTVCGKTFSQNGNLKRHTRTHTDFLPVCEEEKSPEQQERRPDLLQEEPQPPQINEEQQELIHRPEEADGSTLTILAVRSEYNEETEPLASNHFMSSQSHCSESDAEDSDECEETREYRSLKTHSTRSVEGRRFSPYTMERKFSCTVCGKTFNRNGNLKRHTRTHTSERTVSCIL